MRLVTLRTGEGTRAGLLDGDEVVQLDHPDVAAVLAAEPDLAERVYRGWGGIGFRHPDAGYVCGIFPAGGEVRLLFEHGARLDDRDGLLEGEGSQTRYVRVRTPDDGLRAAIARYVEDAVAERLFRR